jgi:hypothetical protein
MSIPTNAELITGMRIISTVPLAKSPKLGEPVKASQQAQVSPKPAPTMQEWAAEARREAGAYLLLYTGLQAKLATLRQKEKGGRDGAIRIPPDGRARGGADAVDVILTALRPLVDGTAGKGHAEAMRKEIARLRDVVKEKATKGHVPSLGAFDQYSSFLKMV